MPPEQCHWLVDFPIVRTVCPIITAQLVSSHAPLNNTYCAGHGQCSDGLDGTGFVSATQGLLEALHTL